MTYVIIYSPAMTRNMQTIMGDNSYSCDACDKSFRRSSHLREHKRIHSGEKPYKCDICSKTLTESSHLITHMRTHTGENPYSCNVCEKSFPERGRHLNKT